MRTLTTALPLKTGLASFVEYLFLIPISFISRTHGRSKHVVLLLGELVSDSVFDDRLEL